MALTFLMAGLMQFFICLPLALRKIPMNSVYGIRIPSAYVSDQRWYDINAYAGLRIALWSWLASIVGAVGFFLPMKDEDIYTMVSIIIVGAAFSIPVIQTMIWIRRLPPIDSKPKP